jgi:hypothetical protein
MECSFFEIVDCFTGFEVQQQQSCALGTPSSHRNKSSCHDTPRAVRACSHSLAPFEMTFCTFIAPLQLRFCLHLALSCLLLLDEEFLLGGYNDLSCRTRIGVERLPPLLDIVLMPNLHIHPRRSRAVPITRLVNGRKKAEGVVLYLTLCACPQADLHTLPEPPDASSHFLAFGGHLGVGVGGGGGSRKIL